MTAPLPSSMLQAASAIGSGRIALVIGAGASVEAPTSMPLSRDLSLMIHGRLVADGLMDPNTPPDPEDLSALADAVFDRFDSQRPLVECMDPDSFRSASPNDGYLAAIALMLEGVVSNLLTLNFDLAATHSLSELSAGAKVAVLKGPEDYGRLGTRNLIYLHRNIECDAEDLVLRTVQIEGDWRNSWQELIARHVLSAPVTIFVGLGTPAAVLIATARAVADAATTAELFLVGPGEHEDSTYAAELSIPAERYVQMGWSEFLLALADRTAAEWLAVVERACQRHFDRGLRRADVRAVIDVMSAIPLVSLGRIRASWLIADARYLPGDADMADDHVAELLIALAVIVEDHGLRLHLREDGTVECWEGDRLIKKVVVAHGRGVYRRAAIELKLGRRRYREADGVPPEVCLCGGVPGSLEEPAPPADITRKADPTSIIRPRASLKLVSVDEVLVGGSGALLDETAA